MAKQLKHKNGAWNNSHTVYVCGNCGKAFSKPPSAKSKFCSQTCEYAAMKLRRGSATPHWKGGRHKCLDCQIEISYTAQCCKSCAAKIMPHTQLKERPWLRTPEVIKKALRRCPMSSLEIKFQKMVDKYQLPYRYVGNGEFMIERKNLDFIDINGEKRAVEVYARKHKENLRNVNIEEWKRERRKVFAKYGWEIVFFDEVQLNNEKNVVSTLKGGVSYF